MRRTRAVLLVFALVACVNLVAAGTGHESLKWTTKPLLMPLLAGYLWLADTRPDRLVLGALAFSTGGDIALLYSGTSWFLAGMALFLGAHLCYISAFTRGGATAVLRRPPLVAAPVGYAVLGVVALAWMWSGLSAAGLAVPVAGYAVALAAMATTAAAHGWRIGLGGALFLISDLMIAIRVADVIPLPSQPVLVMATYIVGQALIVTGWTARKQVELAFH